jgi:hypothetical protein
MTLILRRYSCKICLAILVALALAWTVRDFPPGSQEVKYECDQIKSLMDTPKQVRDHCRDLEIKEMRKKIIINNAIRNQ